MDLGTRYNLYRFSINPINAFQTKLQSDTFFGAFCWSYKYLYGEESLIGLLKDCMSDDVPIVFSNAFSKGYLPIASNFDPSKNLFSDNMSKIDRKDAYQKLKKYKKLTEITLAGFESYRKGNIADISCLGMGEIVSVENIHNQVSRDFGSDSNNDTQLFTTEDYFVRIGNEFDVYVLSLLPENTIRPVVELMLELGIGAKKSTGKGGFVLKNWEEVNNLLECKNANAFIAISNFIPKETDPVRGSYQTFVKNSKIDRNFEGDESPFKKPLLFLSAGSVFYNSFIKPVYGRCINNIAQNSNIIVNACTIALPIIQQY